MLAGNFLALKYSRIIESISPIMERDNKIIRFIQ
jgi:hypothetical protein